MYRFRRWRFNLGKAGKKLPDFTAMVSHPDQDHWKGFEWLLAKSPADQNGLYASCLSQTPSVPIGYKLPY